MKQGHWNRFLMAVAGALFILTNKRNNELVRKASQLGDGSLLGSLISTRVYH